MPTPLYIICSNSGAEDKTTGMVSHFNVIEQLHILKPLPNQPQVPFLVRITAVWLKDDDDNEDQEYEFKVVLAMPPSGTEVAMGAGTVKFTHRLRRISQDAFILGFEGPGTLLATCSIRLVGSSAWITQSYPILLIRIDSNPTKPDFQEILRLEDSD